jgi:hypothetical protein
MNGAGENRYNSNWEKLSKKLRLIYPCAICGENDYKLKEVHHIDKNKKNNSTDNLIVLCIDCHRQIHKNILSLPDVNYKKCGIGVTVAQHASSMQDWFDPKMPLYLLPELPAKIANDFRKKHIKGFVMPQGCNYYLGLHQKLLIGVLGFSVADFGTYDLLLKADTTPQAYGRSTDLLLYVLRTIEVKKLLEQKFNRKINTVYSMCFSQHKQINRYRKHAKKVQEIKKSGGYNLGYLFELGTIPSIKSAKSQWMQKYNIK